MLLLLLYTCSAFVRGKYHIPFVDKVSYHHMMVQQHISLACGLEEYPSICIKGVKEF